MDQAGRSRIKGRRPATVRNTQIAKTQLIASELASGVKIDENPEVNVNYPGDLNEFTTT